MSQVQSWAVGVKNGFPGADVWVTIYNDTAIERIQCAHGGVSSGAISKFTWDDGGTVLGYYVRCETSVTIQGTSHKFSDTTALMDDVPGDVTLLPGEGPSTYIVPGFASMGTPSLNLPTGTDYLLQAGISMTTLIGQIKINTPTGYLSVDPNNADHCVIESRSSLTDTPPGTMIWTKQDTPQGFLLTNKGTNTILYVRGGNGANAQLLPATPVNQMCSLWTIGGTFPSRVAIRPSVDDSQNLNVYGDGPYPPGNGVGTWAWGGGAPNEVWTFVPV